jgi:hypothetical protein
MYSLGLPYSLFPKVWSVNLQQGYRLETVQNSRSHRVLLCSPGWAQTLDPPASASQVLGLQVYTTMPGSHLHFNKALGADCACEFMRGYVPLSHLGTQRLAKWARRCLVSKAVRHWVTTDGLPEVCA